MKPEVLQSEDTVSRETLQSVYRQIWGLLTSEERSLIKEPHIELSLLDARIRALEGLQNHNEQTLDQLATAYQRYSADYDAIIATIKNLPELKAQAAAERQAKIVASVEEPAIPPVEVVALQPELDLTGFPVVAEETSKPNNVTPLTAAKTKARSAELRNLVGQLSASVDYLRYQHGVNLSALRRRINTTPVAALALVAAAPIAMAAGHTIAAVYEEVAPSLASLAASITTPAPQQDDGEAKMLLNGLRTLPVNGQLQTYTNTADQDQHIRAQLDRVLPSEIMELPSFDTHMFDPAQIDGFVDDFKAGLALGLEHKLKEGKVELYSYAMTYAAALHPATLPVLRQLFGQKNGATSVSTFYKLSGLLLNITNRNDAALKAEDAEKIALDLTLLPVSEAAKLDTKHNVTIKSEVALQMLITAREFQNAYGHKKAALVRQIRLLERDIIIKVTMAAHESGVDPAAACKTSSAKGLGQMLNATFIEALRRMHDDPMAAEILAQNPEIRKAGELIELTAKGYKFREDVTKDQRRAVMMLRQDVITGTKIWAWFIQHSKENIKGIAPHFPVSDLTVAMLANFWGDHAIKVFLQTNPNTPIDQVLDFTKTNKKTGKHPRLFSKKTIKANYWILQTTKIDPKTGKPVLNPRTHKPVRISLTVGQVVAALEQKFAIHGPAYVQKLKQAVDHMNANLGINAKMSVFLTEIGNEKEAARLKAQAAAAANANNATAPNPVAALQNEIGFRMGAEQTTAVSTPAASVDYLPMGRADLAVPDPHAAWPLSQRTQNGPR